MIAVYAPSSILSIGNRAFKEAVKLKDFQWNNNIVSIGDYAFASDTNAGYTALVMNELPSGLVNLGPYAFFCAGNDVMVSKIPQKLRKIGD